MIHSSRYLKLFWNKSSGLPLLTWLKPRVSTSGVLHLLVLATLFLRGSSSQQAHGASFSRFAMRRQNFCLEHTSTRLRSLIQCGAWCMVKLPNEACSAFRFSDDVEPKTCECWTAFCEESATPPNENENITHYRNSNCPLG